MHKPFLIIIPIALDLDELEASTGIKKDRIALFVYYLLLRSSNNKESISKITTGVTFLKYKRIKVDRSGAYLFQQLHSNNIYEIITRKPSIKKKIVKAIFEHNPKYSNNGKMTQDGKAFAMSYKLRADILAKGCKVYVISDKTICKKIEVWEKMFGHQLPLAKPSAENVLTMSNKHYHTLAEYYTDPDLSIDLEEASEISGGKFHKKMLALKRNMEKHESLSLESTKGYSKFYKAFLDDFEHFRNLIRIKNRQESDLKTDRFTSRVYYPFVNTPRDYRGCVKYKGKELVEADVSNAHPLYLSLLLDPYFFLDIADNHQNRLRLLDLHPNLFALFWANEINPTYTILTHDIEMRQNSLYEALYPMIETIHSLVIAKGIEHSDKYEQKYDPDAKNKKAPLELFEMNFSREERDSYDHARYLGHHQRQKATGRNHRMDKFSFKWNYIR